MKHQNFFETVAEAHIRLINSIVYYHGPGEEGPYFVHAVTEHKADGKFRIYMQRTGIQFKNAINGEYIPSQVVNRADSSLGPAMDKFMEKHPTFGIVRKDLTSPHFRSFRPFPLGMMNQIMRDKQGKAIDCETLYLERQPNRKTEQGLVQSMVYVSPVTAAMKRAPSPAGYNFDLWSPEFLDCVMGEYPSADKCLSKLRDPRIDNEAAAFHRYFAFVRGPCEMLFLSYKGEIVGMLDNNNLSAITVGRDHGYTREAISELGVFNSIKGR